MRSRIAAVALLATSLLAAGTAQAQSYVRTDCQGLVAGAANRYDTPEHERWYKRFWTGHCERLPLICIPGAPNWNEIVGKLLARASAPQRAALLPKACRLGQMIGLEWSRDKTVRRIDTNDLRVFNSMLEATGDTQKGVDKVEQAARAKLATPAKAP